jgi:hypothetical protein
VYSGGILFCRFLSKKSFRTILRLHCSMEVCISVGEICLGRRIKFAPSERKVVML